MKCNVLSQTEINVIAADLFRQHEQREAFKPFPDRIPTVDDAHEVQNRYVRMLLDKERATIGGYKIALTGQKMRDWLKITEPCAGKVLSSRIYDSPYEARVSDYVRFSFETEVCVVLDREMSGPCTIADVQKNLRSLHCAYELIEDRCADLTKLDVKSLVSDNSWNAGVVLGAAGPTNLDLANRRGWLKVNGALSHEGTTALTMGGNPLAVVAWLSQDLAKRGESIKPGQLVMTGSIIQTQFVGAGNTLEFSVEGLPPVELRLI
jgi:2-keto-4-pentenoate hydratase